MSFFIHSDAQCTAIAGAIADLLGAENGKMRKRYIGLIIAFILDPPWGIIPKCDHDRVISAMDIPTIVAWMVIFLREDGLIAVRLDSSPIQAAVWAKAMMDEGLYVSYIRIIDTKAKANSRCCANMKRPSNTTNGHNWVIGRRTYQTKRATSHFGTYAVFCLALAICSNILPQCTYADTNMSDYPPTCADINNVPRVPSATKLQREFEQDDGSKVFSPWRTQENHISEILAIIHLYVPEGGIIWDPCCGAMTTALAAMRLNRKVIVSDRDAPLVKAAEIRAKYYFAWLQITYPGLANGLVPSHDGLNHYRFNQVVVPATKNHTSGATESLPVYSTAPKLAKVGTQEHDTYCASMGVKIMQSTLVGAGLGLFLVAPGFLGQFRAAYFGKYGTESRGDRAIILQSAGRNTTVDLVLNGDPACPATFANDPMVHSHLPSLELASFSLPCTCSLPSSHS